MIEVNEIISFLVAEFSKGNRKHVLRVSIELSSYRNTSISLRGLE